MNAQAIRDAIQAGVKEGVESGVLEVLEAVKDFRAEAEATIQETKLQCEQLSANALEQAT
jgi:hypothetical protein